MKSFGVLLLVLGIGLGIYAFNLDTSVPVSYSGNTGFPTRVNNLGLMNEKQNYLIAAGVLAIIGVIMIATAKPDKKFDDEQGLKKCPQCAETVKAEARICRFCDYQFPENNIPAS